MRNHIKRCLKVLAFLIIMAVFCVAIIYDITRNATDSNGGGLIETAEKRYIRTTKVNVVGNQKIWQIKIPKIELVAPIMEDTTQDVLTKAVGHFRESNKWKGNVAFAAHNRGYVYNFFQKIKDLEKGDIIIYSTNEGKRIYRVVVNTVIRETDWSYIEDTQDNRITLITCEADRREYRRCVQGIEDTREYSKFII